MLTIPQIQNAVENSTHGYPIRKVFLFGSYANGTATEGSDVDILVEFCTNPISYFKVGGFLETLKEALGVDVDLLTLPLENPPQHFRIGRTVKLYEAPDER